MNVSKVMRGKVLVEMKDKPKETKTESGIVLAALKIKDTDRFVVFGEGVVKQVGEGAIDEFGNTIPSQLKPGDYILWQRYAETKIDENLAVLDEKAVFAVINNSVAP